MSEDTARGPVAARIYGVLALLRAFAEQGFDHGEEVLRSDFERAYVVAITSLRSRLEEGWPALEALCQLTQGVERLGKNRWIDEILAYAERLSILKYSQHGMESTITLCFGSKRVLVEKLDMFAPTLLLGEAAQVEFLRLCHAGVLHGKNKGSMSWKRDSY